MNKGKTAVVLSLFQQFVGVFCAVFGLGLVGFWLLTTSKISEVVAEERIATPIFPSSSLNQWPCFYDQSYYKDKLPPRGQSWKHWIVVVGAYPGSSSGMIQIRDALRNSDNVYAPEEDFDGSAPEDNPEANPPKEGSPSKGVSFGQVLRKLFLPQYEKDKLKNIAAMLAPAVESIDQPILSLVTWPWPDNHRIYPDLMTLFELSVMVGLKVRLVVVYSDIMETSLLAIHEKPNLFSQSTEFHTFTPRPQDSSPSFARIAHHYLKWYSIISGELPIRGHDDYIVINSQAMSIDPDAVLGKLSEFVGFPVRRVDRLSQAEKLGLIPSVQLKAAKNFLLTRYDKLHRTPFDLLRNESLRILPPELHSKVLDLEASYLVELKE